jgi:DNA-binding transcriptional LysR family regulator
MIALRELEHLTVLCEHRQFGRAAAALGLSQPALTKSIQRLERELGARLVDRSKTGVLPTPLGAEVLHRARHILSGAAELQREIELLSGASRGALTVGIGPAMSESPLIECIARLLDGRSGILIQLRIDHWNQLSAWLLDRQLDLFIADLTEARRDDRFDCRPLPPERIVWFCRAGHPLAALKRVTRRDMLKYPLATPRMPEWARDWFAAEANVNPSSPAAPFVNLIECENFSILKRIVLASDAVSAALRSTIAAEADDGSIVSLKIKAPPLNTEAGIVTLRGRTLSPLAEALIADINRQSAR